MTTPTAPVHTFPITAGASSDIDTWNTRFNRVIDNSSTDSPAVEKYKISFWKCWSPSMLCLTTWCFPCVTFGRTYHRTAHNGDMNNYGPVNLVCCAQCVMWYCSFHYLLPCVQTVEIRKRYKLHGNMCVDCLKHYFCPCCALIQAEKESELREAERTWAGHEQYLNNESMVAASQISGEIPDGGRSSGVRQSGDSLRGVTFAPIGEVHEGQLGGMFANISEADEGQGGEARAGTHPAHGSLGGETLNGGSESEAAGRAAAENQDASLQTAANLASGT